MNEWMAKLFVQRAPNVDSKLNVSKCAFHATFHKVYTTDSSDNDGGGEFGIQT